MNKLRWGMSRENSDSVSVDRVRATVLEDAAESAGFQRGKDLLRARTRAIDIKRSACN